MAEQETKRTKYTRYLHILLRCLMVVCVIGIVRSALLMFLGNREYARGDTAYEQVRSVLQQQEPAQQGQDPTVKIDFVALAALNKDTVAWLRGQETVIDYPVVQGKDNDFYLTHLFNGETNKLGCLFVDYRSNGAFSGKNTIIYGHNMKDGSMFASLTSYQQQAYYDSHPSMELYTPDGAYTIEFFAGILADGTYEFVRMGFDGDEDFLAYVDTLKADSSFQSNVEVGPQDRIVTLCTCSYEFSNARYALFGKLTPIKGDES